VPIQAPPDGVLLLVPTVQLTLDSSATDSPAPVATTLTVTGLFQHTAHVSLEMHYAPSGVAGCRNTSWPGTSVSKTGPATTLVAASGVTSVSASTGQLPALGCWYPVAVLSVDANPAITARTGLDDADAVISAGLDPNANHAVASGPTRHGSSWLPAIIAGGAVAGLEVALSVVVLLIARRSASRPARDSQQLTDELIAISTD
jgi:hypothetical protein